MTSKFVELIGWCGEHLVHAQALVPLSKRLNPLLASLLDSLLAAHNALDLLQDGVPGLELKEWNVLVNTVGNKIMSTLSEEEIGLLSSRQVGDSVTGVEHGWALISWEVGVWADGDGFVVSEIAVKSCQYVTLKCNFDDWKGKAQTCHHGKPSPIHSHH